MKNCRPAQIEPRILIDEDFCKGCQLCIRVCPRQVLTMGKKRNRAGYLLPELKEGSKCSACLLCELTCPDLVLTVEKGGK